jgi:hypothetical protein
MLIKSARYGGALQPLEIQGKKIKKSPGSENYYVS